MRRLRIIDSTTISLFSNLIFKGVGRHPKTSKKKGGIKVHTIVQVNEGVPSDIWFTSAVTNNTFMLKPSSLSNEDITAVDRAYMDYEKFEQMTQKEIIYVTRIKKNLKYNILDDTIIQTEDRVAELRIQAVTFTKVLKGNQDPVIHHAHIITCVDVKKESAYLSVDQ